MENSHAGVCTVATLTQPGFQGKVGGETLAPCGWGDREWSLVASMHCQAEYPYGSGSGQCAGGTLRDRYQRSAEIVHSTWLTIPNLDWSVRKY